MADAAHVPILQMEGISKRFVQRLLHEVVRPVDVCGERNGKGAQVRDGGENALPELGRRWRLALCPEELLQPDREFP